MPRFRYQSVDAEGKPISGEVEASRIDEALETLAAGGIYVERGALLEIAEEVGGQAGGGRPLTTGEAARFVGDVSELTRSQMPLGPGLRAMADELHGGWTSRLMHCLGCGIGGVIADDLRGHRLSRLFRQLSRQTDEGVSLETAVSEMGDRFPRHVRGLILAGNRSGRLAEVLAEYAALQRERSDVSWRIAVSMAYPLLMFSMLVPLFMLCGLYVAPPMASLFEDFGADLPAITVLFLATSIGGTRALTVLLMILVPLLLLWLVLPRPRWATRCLYSIPFVGAVWKWQGLVEFSRLMGLLLAQDVPLPEALRLAGDGVRSPALEEACLKSAAQVEAGEAFIDCIERQKAFPPTLRPFVDAGNQLSRPSEGFEAAAEVFQKRISVDAALWEIVIPPLMLVLIGGFVGFMVVSLCLPLISLITNLS